LLLTHQTNQTARVSQNLHYYFNNPHHCDPNFPFSPSSLVTSTTTATTTPAAVAQGFDTLIREI
jgi:hypothetical protein